jgi:hypothetical protein
MLTVRRLATMRAALVISMAALVAESGSAQSFKTIYSFQGAPTAKDQMARSSEKTGSSTARPIAGGASQCTNDDTWTQPCGTIFEPTDTGAGWTNHVL